MAREKEIVTGARADWNNGLKEITRTKSATAENTTARNKATRLVWTSAAALFADGSLTPVQCVVAIHKAQNGGDEPKANSKVYGVRISEATTIAAAAKEDINRLLACWPPMSNEGKTMLTQQEFVACARAVADPNDKRSADEIRKVVRNTTATFEGALKALVKSASKLEKTYPADTKELRVYIRGLSDFYADNYDNANAA